MRTHILTAVRRACRALLVPTVLTLAVVAASAQSDVRTIEWEEPALLRRVPADTVAAAATSGAARAPAPSTSQSRRPTSCDPNPSTPIPTMVAAIFRCRLTEAGLPPDQVNTVTAEAVTVAQCESEFDPNAVIFDGRYLNAPHPYTGSYYSATGIFQFIRDRADRWIEGGYANATDPVANIDAAARVYLHNIRRGYAGWSDWACAAANDGFRPVSVLPGWPGGPPHLPAWAFEH